MSQCEALCIAQSDGASMDQPERYSAKMLPPSGCMVASGAVKADCAALQALCALHGSPLVSEACIADPGTLQRRPSERDTSRDVTARGARLLFITSLRLRIFARILFLTKGWCCTLCIWSTVPGVRSQNHASSFAQRFALKHMVL